jgi:hypothetical protein
MEINQCANLLRPTVVCLHPVDLGVMRWPFSVPVSNSPDWGMGWAPGWGAAWTNCLNSVTAIASPHRAFIIVVS